MTSTYALIMAGGAGTRLWPLSRQGRPKPLLNLTEAQRSMFQIAIERLYPLFTPEQILVVASADLTALLREQAPELPATNFIIEPMGRDTAPAVGLGAVHIRHRDPDAVMVVLAADHHIADVLTFRRVLAAASQTAATSDAIITLGIPPRFPSTGFGYIERGARQQIVDGIEVYSLQRFTEKPDRAAAAAFVASGRYSWNSGMFLWTVQRVMAEYARHAPDLHERLEEIAASIGTPAYADTLARVWPQMRRISVDFALMEHIRENVSVIPVEMGWSDIGSFEALYDILSTETGQNVAFGPSPLLIDTHGTLVYSQRQVAMIGIEDLVVVDTDDALLICRRDQTQKVKGIVEQLKEGKQDRYL